ncbi:RagB/SusD family nutrient uptake outer membrane protein [Mucilaginibacter pocheonensis]|uniref:Starch-binding associating with outer membrane n=1 Tax=Mucilaginibacter pocheonensis TaxID=398050 RepID=A0ABU1TH35_9SPHI|nr:RagB/SusD family nutrient uptake outer membrane protein [Mucilaginibacter pocheonensis]MDR6944733.1 hypothetical protein [Mucilaginibacter pocheonensis]
MKRINKIWIFSLCAVLGLSACKKDFLNKGVPTDKLVANTYYQTSAELRAATAGLYTKPWFDFNYPFIVYVGDVMSGNTVSNPYNTNASQFSNFTIANGYGGLSYGWSSLFNVVAQSNTTINNVTNFSPVSLGSARTAAIGEARFMRAAAYFYLVQLWGPVPIVESSDKLVDKPLLHRNIQSDIYKFIINDLHYAASNLPATDDPGRVTKWSAKGLLAKVFLTKAGITGTRVQSDLDSAKYYAADVINNSGLSLFPNYYDAFLTLNKNNPEMLFGLQFTVATGADWTTNDFRQTAIEGDPNIDGIGGGGWDGLRISKDMFDNYSLADKRRKATFMLNGDIYPELITTQNPNGYSMTDASGAYVKKYVIGGPLANRGDNITLMHGDMPNYLLRLADVYLVYVEAALGTNASTSDATALNYFNQIRTRAGLPIATSLTFDDVFKERRLELALEYQFWFDLKRLHDYNPAKAEAFIKAQHRNAFTYTAGATTEPTVTQVTPAYYTLPYPAVEVTADPLLTQAPVAYY